MTRVQEVAKQGQWRVDEVFDFLSFISCSRSFGTVHRQGSNVMPFCCGIQVLSAEQLVYNFNTANTKLDGEERLTYLCGLVREHFIKPFTDSYHNYAKFGAVLATTIPTQCNAIKILEGIGFKPYELGKSHIHNPLGTELTLWVLARNQK